MKKTTKGTAKLTAEPTIDAWRLAAMRIKATYSSPAEFAKRAPKPALKIIHKAKMHHFCLYSCKIRSDEIMGNSMNTPLSNPQTNTRDLDRDIM